MTRTPLLLVPGVLCSPRLFAAQVAALSNQADIVVPDWRTAPLSIWDSWESAARWVVDQMPAEKFALAGLSLGGMLAVEIMQFAAHRVTKLALLDTGMRSQSESERAIRRARIRLANVSFLCDVDEEIRLALAMNLLEIPVRRNLLESDLVH